MASLKVYCDAEGKTLTLGIFITANYLAYMIRFEFNVPPVEMGVA